MFRYILLLISLLATVYGFDGSFAAPPPPPTTFEVTLVDQANKNIGSPAFLLVTEMLDGKEVLSYRIDVRSNPEEIPVRWYVPAREANTEIHIVAAKQGYENSEEFVFTITAQTPKEGILFKHTFKLNLEESSKTIDTTHQVDAFGNSYTINTKSTSNIQTIEFDEEQNALFVILSGDALRGSTDLTIPKSLIKPPFTVLLDNNVIFPKLDEKSQSSTLHIVYSNGQHNILVLSQVEKPTQAQQTTDDEFRSTDGGGCLIATTAFGSEMAPQVQFLREIRDNTVLSTASGTSFMTAFNSFYYSFSPTVADWERQNPVFKEIVKATITPLLSSLSLLQYVDIDTEEEMLGYGIGIILLNIGMYFVGPAFLIVKLKSRFGKIYA